MNEKQKRKFTEKLESQNISRDRLRKNIDAERHPEEQIFDSEDQMVKKQKDKGGGRQHVDQN